jgi:cell division protein FtsI/penicillin-binding protein 2
MAPPGGAVETSVGGRAVRNLSTNATPGNTVMLSLDQAAKLVEDIGDRRGALVALDPRSGDVLVSSANRRLTRTCLWTD